MENTPQTEINRKMARRVDLLKEDIKTLKNYRKTFNSDADFSHAMNMDRGTLYRIIELGRSSEVNAIKIKNLLNSLKVQN